MIKQYKIQFLIGELYNGGAERVMATIANALALKGHKVSLLAIMDDRLEYKLNENIEYKALNFKRKSKITKIFERLHKTRSSIKKNNPDIIISFLTGINLYAIVANIGLKSKVIVSERNDPNNDPESKLLRNMRDIIYNFSDGCVFQTSDAKDYFNKKIREKAVIIANPLMSELQFKKVKQRKKEIITVARLAKQKNLAMLIDAYSILVKEYTDYKLIIYGRGDQEEFLKCYARKKCKNDNVQFKGYLSNWHEEAYNAKMFVLSSNYEGLSNSMLEAMAIGMPVISTDHPIGGARQFIKNEINGLLIPVGDTKALYNSMKKIIENMQFADKLSANAIKIKEELNVFNVLKQWEAYIKKTLN